MTGGASWTSFPIIGKIPQITSSCEIYNPSNNRFSGTGSMRSSRAGHVVTKLANGDVLVSGGARLSGIDPVIINNAGTYSVSGGNWTATAIGMSLARAGHATALLPDNRVLIIGGAVGSLSSPGSTNRVDFYDPSTRRFSTAPALGVARAGAHALVLPEGQVFVAGGGGGPNNAALATGEMYFQ